MAFNVGMFVWGVWEFTPPHWETENDILRITLPIARGAGRLVTWNTALLLLSASKYFWTLVRQTPIQLGFPVDNIMPKYHRIIALTIIVAGCVIHTIPQVVNYATKEIEIKGGNKIWTFGDGFATLQLLITGIALFVIFAVFFVTTLSRVRRTTWGFRIFWACHIFGVYMVLPLLLIHGTSRGYPLTTYFCIGPLCLYIGDSLLRRFLFASMDATVVTEECHSDGGDKVVKLVIHSDTFTYTAGQYAELKIPQISGNEWHPFTIASASSKQCKGEATFYIKGVVLMSS
eukprot:scaffold21589_cov56-Attheya_sp.AAC.6